MYLTLYPLFCCSPPMANGRKVIRVPADELKVELTKLRPTTQYKVTLSAGNHRVDGVVQNVAQYTSETNYI